MFSYFLLRSSNNKDLAKFSIPRTHVKVSELQQQKAEVLGGTPESGSEACKIACKMRLKQKARKLR